MTSDLNTLRQHLSMLSVGEGLDFLSSKYPGKVVFSSAFGQEDQVITDTILKYHIPIEIFTLDTGRLFPETYELIDATRSRYRASIKTYFPKTESVEKLITEKGMHSFYGSVNDRKECCYIRKVEPLKRALKGAKVWVTGLRAGQSTNRESFELIEWDEGNQVFKYNPLLHWSYDEMITYLEKNQVPYNPLHNKGFVSIGCAPCTRAIEPGEDPRAGRWWWESSHKECGLHQVESVNRNS